MESSTRTQEHRVGSAADALTNETRVALAGATADRCAKCAASLATDQRYCVECGEPRGAARLPFGDAQGQAGDRVTVVSRPPRGLRISSGSTLIAGVATLLLAMGVGVLIGRSSNGSGSKGTPVSVVTVGGGGQGAAAGSAATQTAPASTAKAKQPTTHAARAAGASASGVSAQPPKVVHIGSAGHGPGYKNGHFTGNFFGE